MREEMKAENTNGNPKKTFHNNLQLARPHIGQEAVEIQAFGTIIKLPNGLSERSAGRASVG